MKFVMKQGTFFCATMFVVQIIMMAVADGVYSLNEENYKQSNFEKSQVNKSGSNVYAFWFSNITGNDEIMFRSSTDGGKTFADRANLIQSANTSSQGHEIATSHNDIVVSWWNRNVSAGETGNTGTPPNGLTFGVVLLQPANGTFETPK